MSGNKGKWQNRVYDEDRPSSYQIDRDHGNRVTTHGEEGHTGWKCIECAMEAKLVVSAFPPHDDDHWQDVQLIWQEECDKLHSAKINHLPDHTPNDRHTACWPDIRGSSRCVIYTEDPAKPKKQFERLGSRVQSGQ